MRCACSFLAQLHEQRVMGDKGNGMNKDGFMQETQRVHEEMCLDPKWSWKPLPEQIE